MKKNKAVEAELALDEFQAVQKKIDSSYANAWERDQCYKEKSFADLAADYRRHYKTQVYKYFSNRSVFTATLNGAGPDEPSEPSPPPPQTNSNSNARQALDKSICICGAKHRFKDCPYLLEKARTRGWREDPAIRKVFDEKLANIPALRGAADKAIRVAGKASNNTSTGQQNAHGFSTIQNIPPAVPDNTQYSAAVTIRGAPPQIGVLSRTSPSNTPDPSPKPPSPKAPSPKASSPNTNPSSNSSSSLSSQAPRPTKRYALAAATRLSSSPLHARSTCRTPSRSVNSLSTESPSPLPTILSPVARRAVFNASLHTTDNSPKPLSTVTSILSKGSRLAASVDLDPEHPLRRSTIGDTGADTHVLNRFMVDRFSELKEAPEEAMLMHGDTSTRIEAFGTAHFLAMQDDGSTKEVDLYDVAYVPSFHTNLVSLTRAAENGMDFQTMDKQTKLRLSKEGKTVAIAIRAHKQWVLEYHPTEFTSEGDPSNPYIFAFTKSSAPLLSSATFDRWRSRIGWPSEESVRLLPRSASGIEISDLPAIKEAGKLSEKPVNEAYELANPKHQVSRRSRHHPPTYPFEHVWMDLIIYSQTAYDGTKAILHYYCTYSGVHVVERLFSKADINSSIPATITFMEKQFNCSVKQLHMDDERGLSDAFQAWVNRTGRLFNPTAPYTAEQAGPIERSHRTLGEKQRFLGIEAQLPEELYPEFWSTAAYLANRTPTRSRGGKSPWQIVNEWLSRTNTKPLLGHLKIYGSRAYVLDNKVPKGHKSSARAHIGYLVGYDSTNIFRVWIPHLKQVI